MRLLKIFFLIVLPIIVSNVVSAVDFAEVKHVPELIERLTLETTEGDLESQYSLALLHELFGHEKQALEGYKKGMEEGHFPSAKKVGAKLYNAKSYVEAFDLFCEFAEKGHVYSMLMLCDMYWKGRGVLESNKEAFKWAFLALNHPLKIQTFFHEKYNYPNRDSFFYKKQIENFNRYCKEGEALAKEWRFAHPDSAISSI